MDAVLDNRVGQRHSDGTLAPTEAREWRVPAVLTVGSTGSVIWNTSWPIVLNMMVLSLANFCEGWIAGRLGADSLSAIGIASQIWFFAMLLTLALSAGTISVLSRICGAGDRLSTIESAWQALLLSVIFGGAISILSLLAARPMLGLLGASPAVTQQGWDYLNSQVLLLCLTRCYGFPTRC